MKSNITGKKLSMEQKFDTLSIGKLVFQLGIPAMLAQFFNILYSITDCIFVGHIAGQGEFALASIGICAPLLTAVTAFSTLIGIGGASVMSIAVGQKDYKNAEAALNHAWLLLFILSGVLTGGLLILEKPLLYALGCSSVMYLQASGYFSVY